ncbi:unnamed protein product, partial [Symbiodinium microadriaticum]
PCPALLDALLAAYGPICVVFHLDCLLVIWIWAARIDPARTLLRQFVDGVIEPSLVELDIACRRLEGHHSRSVLPGRARAIILQGQTAEMPASGKLQPWHCGTCQRQNKGNQDFCGGCGSHWQKVTYWSGSASQAAPWRPPQGAWQSPASPRRPRSPRKRAGKGQQGPEAPVAKGAPPPPQPTAPTLQALPVPPPMPTSTTVREQINTPAAEANPDRVVLQKLVQALGQHQELLPEGVREILAAQGRTEVQDHTKSLHRTVSAQATARRELQRIRQGRAAFLATWNTYITDLTTLVAKQVEEQGKALADMDEQEEMWGGKLQEATASLAKLANKGITPEPKTAMDVDALDVVELAEAKVDEAIATEQERHDRRQQQQQSAFQLVAALKQAQEKAGKDLAEQTSQREREGSRTPRRGGQAGPATAEISSSSPGSSVEMQPVPTKPSPAAVPGKA